MIKMVDHLFIDPIVRVADAQKVMGLTYPAALSGLRKLVDAGILSQLQPEAIPVRFVAGEILKAVNAEPTRR